MMKMSDLKDLLQVVIIKMKESSGNEQFFVQLRHKGCNGILRSCNSLDYHCHQTMVQSNEVNTVEKCLEHSWFSASMLSRFISSSKEDVVIIGLTEEEINYMKQQTWLGK